MRYGFWMTLKIKTTCLKWRQKHRKRRKINTAKVLPVKTTRARARVCTWKQHVHVLVNSQLVNSLRQNQWHHEQNTDIQKS